jgi:hypothetical protein
MRKQAIIFYLFLGCFFPLLLQAQSKAINFDNCKRCIVLCEQSVNRVAILDLDKNGIVWEWRPEGNIKPAHLAWYNAPSDAKAVYGGTCILTTASGGAVSLIRISDKKVLFYAYAGGNTHSADVLPDGNIVSASSTGNYMTVFSTDTLNFPENVYKKNIPLSFGHNVVWDQQRKRLWSAAQRHLKSFSYNFDKKKPDFSPLDSVAIPGVQAHDLFPDYSKQMLWLSNTTGVYQFDIKTGKLTTVTTPLKDVKSISTGPAGLPILMIHPMGVKNGWWTDVVTTIDGKVLFQQAGFKLYKARWYVDNKFSYQAVSKKTKR